MNNLVRQKLREIVIKHGRPPLTDTRLCESLLKDYCGEFKKEIFLLVCAVREQVATDLLISKNSVPRDMLNTLLVKRLQKNLSLTEEASRWAVESWSLALAGLSLEAPPNNPSRTTPLELETAHSPSSASGDGGERVSFPGPVTKFANGLLGNCERAVRAVACSPCGESLVSGSDDGKLRLWNLDTGRMRIIGGFSGPVTSVAFSPDGACVAAASENQAHGSNPLIAILDLHTGELLKLGECNGRAPVIAYSPGGKSLVAASSETENCLKVWNLRTGHTRVFKSEAGGLLAVSFAPDGQSVATGDGSLSHAAIRLWDLETERPRILGHCSRRVTSVAFNMDGKRLASGSWDETVRLWNVQTGQTRVLGKNCSCINCVIFSRDGAHVAACSLDGKIRVWDIETERSRIIGECHGVNSAIFSADSRSIITGSLDGTIRLWPLA